MKSGYDFNRLFLAALALILVIAGAIFLGQTNIDVLYAFDTLQSPPKTLSPKSNLLYTPLRSEAVVSGAAQKGLVYISEREDIPTEALIIAADHPTEYPASGRKFQVVTLIDTRRGGQVYKLLVDLTNGQIEEDISTLLSTEIQIHQTRYGKLDPALYKRLQALKDDDLVPVAIWMTTQPNKTLAEQQEAAFATLAAKYPEAQSALTHSGKPMDVGDPELAQRIEAEYISLLATEAQARIQPLVKELEDQGVSIITYAGLPTFTAILPKQTILSLAQHTDVSNIYLIEAHKQPEMESVAPTILAPTVWARGHSGSGVTIAILDIGNVDSNNTYLNLSPASRAGANNPYDIGYKLRVSRTCQG